MEAIEIVLLILGLALVVASFFLQEKLQKKDIEQIEQLNEKELQIIVERQLKHAEDTIEAALEEKIDLSVGSAQRKMEKLSNEKIMAISEYSDTVLGAINKSHDEIMFLYSMLNDKHSELTDLAAQLQTFSKNLRATENEMLTNIAEAAAEMERVVVKTEPINEEEVLVESVEQVEGPMDEESNHNALILEMSKRGMQDVEIAKELGLGIGEVRLVLGLFREG